MSTHVNPQALRGASPAVDRLEDALEVIGGLIERKFVFAGEKLAIGIDLVGRVSGELTQLVAIVEDQAVTNACDVIANMDERLATMRAEIDADDRWREAVHCRLMATSTTVSGLTGKIEAINAVAINARVSAAGLALDGSMQELFSKDIAELCVEARAIVGGFAETYGQMLVSLSGIRRATHRFRASIGRPTDTTTTELSLGVAAVHAQRSVVAATAAELASDLGGRSEQISDLLMALQVGDATRQRIDHIVEGIDLAAAATAGRSHPAFGDTALDPADLEAAGATILGVQAHQLEALAADFEETTADVRNRFADLVQALSDTLRKGRQEIASLARPGRSPLSALEQSLKAARAQLCDGAMHHQRMEALASQFQQTIAGLLDQSKAVRDVEHRMRILSLNTAIHSVKRGQMAAVVGTISRQLRELAAEAGELSQTATTALQETAAAMQDSGRDTGGHAGRSLQEADRATADALGQLTGLDKLVVVADASLERTERDITRLVSHVGRILAEQDATRDELQKLSAAMSHIAPISAAAQSDAVSAALSWLRARYTMERERDILDHVQETVQAA